MRRTCSAAGPARGGPPVANASPFGSLTRLVRGKSNKEIGANVNPEGFRDYISETTGKSHLRSIFTKLNVLRRTEPIVAASRRGLAQM